MFTDILYFQKKKSFKNIIYIFTKVIYFVKLLWISWKLALFQTYNKLGHNSFLHILRSEYGLKILKVTKAEMCSKK